MNKYTATSMVRLPKFARVKLTKEQAAPRRHNLDVVDEKAGIYEVKNTIEFKAGEVFGYDGELPKAERMNIDSGADSGKKKETPPLNMDNVIDIIDVIDDLDQEKDFTSCGKPDVKALEALLDRKLTAAERDEAWKQYQESAE